MFPVLFHLGPVTLAGFLIFSLVVFLSWFIAARMLKNKPAVVRDLFFLMLVLIAASLVLFILNTAGIMRASLPIRAYGFMTAIGFFGATLFITMEGKKIGIDSNSVLDVAVISLIFGIIGARIFYIVFFDWNYYMMNPGKMIAIWEGGQVLFGGIIFGGLAIYLYIRKKKIPVLKFLDLTAMSLLIGIGLGRLGCLGFGCCYGLRSDACGITFPPGSPAYIDQVNKGMISASAVSSLKVIPTQILSFIGAFLLFGLMYLIYKKANKFDGQTMSLTLITYSIGRFIIEMFRDNLYIGTLTAAQWTCIPVCILGIILFFALKAKAGHGSVHVGL